MKNNLNNLKMWIFQLPLCAFCSLLISFLNLPCGPCCCFFQRTMILLLVITQAPQNTTSLTPVVNAQPRLAWIFRPRRSSESKLRNVLAWIRRWAKVTSSCTGMVLRWGGGHLVWSWMRWSDLEVKQHLEWYKLSCQFVFGKLASVAVAVA